MQIRCKSDTNKRPSEAIRGNQRPSEAIRGNQRPSEDAQAVGDEVVARRDERVGIVGRCAIEAVSYLWGEERASW